MSERAIDDTTMKVGLLMESAQAHQRLAETHLERLRAHTRGLDDVVREAIRSTLIEELQDLAAESRRAALAISATRRAANMRGLLWSVGISVMCTAIPIAIARYALPSASDIAALRDERERLVMSVYRLEQRGGRVDWGRCGDAARLCVRVDRSTPAYGDKADYYILKGY
jgi:hypothetical protein